MKNRDPYDTSIDWLQPQFPADRQEAIYMTQQQEAAQIKTTNAAKKAAPSKQARMPKQKALELVSSLKKGIVVSSIMSFGLFGFLATGHTIETTASITKTTTPITRSSSSTAKTPSKASTSSSSKSTTSSKKSSTASTPSSSGSSTSQGGASFGSSSSQSSVSGTSVS